jgi:hypothetical protein
VFKKGNKGIALNPTPPHFFLGGGLYQNRFDRCLLNERIHLLAISVYFETGLKKLLQFLQNITGSLVEKSKSSAIFNSAHTYEENNQTYLKRIV